MAKPSYKITIDPEFSDGEDLGWAKTAFTNKPAITIKGVSFSADEQRSEMFFADKLKYRIAAPAMIPMEIYRNDEDGEYYVEFTSKEIEKIHKKFMKNLGKNKDLFNLEHDNSEIVPAYILEILLLDTQAKVDMILTDYKIKVPVGTLFVIAQVTDKDYYNQLVENEQTGFSIEGFLGLSLQELEEKQKSKTNKNEEMKNENVKLADASILKDGDKFQIGDKAYIVKDGSIIEDVIEIEAAEDVKEEELAEDAKEEVKEEELAEDVKEEELAEDVKEEVKEDELAEDAPVAEDVKEEELAEDDKEEVKEEEMAEGDEEVPAADFYSKEEVDSKLDEIFKMIAELKGEEVIEEDEVAEVALSVHERMAAFSRFSKKS